MNGFGKNFEQFKQLQGTFEKLVGQTTSQMTSEAAEFASKAMRGQPAHALHQQAPGGLHEVASFGTNPGNLRMQMYVPAKLEAAPPLVVALHGCGQSAEQYAVGTGWSKLAEQLGFVVLYPEQQSANNPNSCFSWFVPNDVRREGGESQSIHQMVEHIISAYGVDRNRVFVTGLSAGGAMANVMLAAYPDTFAAGAIIAGLPYGTAASVQEAFTAMFTDQQHSHRALGDRVRSASSERGRWPRIAIWHGTADQVVRPSNADHIAGQWADVHGIAALPSFEGLHGRHVQRRWNDADGNPLIEQFAITGMAHGVPLDGAAGTAGLGLPGPFFLDAGISSTQHIARFWGLGEVSAEHLRPTVGLGASADTRPSGPQPAGAPPAHDIGDFFTSTLKAANLPLSAKGSASPASIIEAALKAAGLKR